MRCAKSGESTKLSGVDVGSSFVLSLDFVCLVFPDGGQMNDAIQLSDLLGN